MKLTFFKQYLPEIIIIGLGFSLRIAFASMPLSLLLTLLPDDAWMVTSIARHWALGHGITADGLSPTNGFHPLYPLSFGALPYLFNTDLDFGFRANLVLCALFSGLALLPFYSLARKFAQRPLALAGLALLSLNPLLISQTVNAMETSLALLLLLTLWWYGLETQKPSLKEILILSFLAAAATLARLDNLIAVTSLGLYLLWNEIQQKQFPKQSISYGLGTGLLLLPYFAHNLVVFGHLTPSSGRALAYLHSYRESFAFTSGFQIIAHQTAIDLTWAPSWLLFLCCGLLILAIFLLSPNQRKNLSPQLIYIFTLTFYYSYLQQQGLPRYYVGVSFVIILLLCCVLNKQLKSGLQTKLMLISVNCLIAFNCLLNFSAVNTLLHAPYLSQPTIYNAARWIAQNLPPDARLAALNSGVFQYYSEHIVLNIDGKLNNEIIPVLEKRELDRYLRDKEISYLIDLPEIADYITFYSQNLSEAKPHLELTNFQKLKIYLQMSAAKVGLGKPVKLDERVPIRILYPFTEVTETVQQFPLPNAPQQAVMLYLLKPNFGEGKP